MKLLVNDPTRNLYITIENVPNTNYDKNGKFCGKNLISNPMIPYRTMIAKCVNQYAGRYILFHIKRFPDRSAAFYVINLYAYGKKSTFNEITGLFFFLFRIQNIINIL